MAKQAMQPTRSGEVFRAEVIGEFDRIAASATFSKVERPVRFLRHLVETALRDDPERLKESSVGVDVFDRPASWDPRIDPIVRQEAARLRKRLARYYATANWSSGIRIELPVGTYVPVFQIVSKLDSPKLAEPAALITKVARTPWAKRWIAAGALVCAAILASLVWYLVPKPPPGTMQAKSQAEDFYLRGLHYWERRTPESLNQAVDLFTQAIVHDPRYARAYVGLADSYNLLREYSAMPEQEAFPRALAATQKALELDNRLAEAHSSLAFISFWWNRDAATADREFRRAITLDPNQVTPHHWYATFLYGRGRHREALEQIDMAQRLAPASSAVLADKGLILHFAGRRDEAFALLKQLDAENPAPLSAARYLAFLYLAERDYPNYLAELQRVAAVCKDPVSLAMAAAAEKGFNSGGPKAMLEHILATQLDLHGKGQMPIYYAAQTYALLGRTSEALRCLEASSQESFSSFACYRLDPAFRDLRSNPAFHEFDSRFEPKIAAGTFLPHR